MIGRTRDFKPMTTEEIAMAHVGELTPLPGLIEIAEYDPEWTVLFDRERARIESVLGKRAKLIEHVGSTSVPGLAANPRIDMLLSVADSSDEKAYVPDLATAGYVLKIREPGWHEHRMLTGPDTDVNLHVFSPGCVEIERMLSFRDWLRANDGERALYEVAKRELAAQSWEFTQNYADAKTQVVEEIIARAQTNVLTPSPSPSR
ncbi:GrpB family protein [soil metagenome]